MPRNFNDMRVTLHGHAPEDLDEPYDITEFVSELQWSDSVNPPWNTCTVTLQLQKHQLDRVLPGPRTTRGASRRMRPGAWIVIAVRDVVTRKHTALSLCYLQNITIGFGRLANDKGPTGTVPVLLHGVSWFTAVGSSNIRVASTDSVETAREDKVTKAAKGGGFIFDLQSWSILLQKVLSNAASFSMGESLRTLWHELATTTVPKTLIGRSDSTFQENVVILYRHQDGGTVAPARVNAIPPVYGAYMLSLPQILPATQMWQWMYGTFVPDSNIVELFPSLEWPDAPEDGPRRFLDEVSVDGPTGPIGSTAVGYGSDTSGAAPSSATTDAPAPLNSPISHGLGGAQPVLIYRFKPFQLVPINATSAARDETAVHGAMSPSADTSVPNTTQPTAEKLGLFQRPVDPVPPNEIAADRYTFDPDEIIRISDATVSDLDRVNLVFSLHPLSAGSQNIRMYGQAGDVVLPSTGEFERYGLRAAEPTWPYVLPTPEKSESVLGTALKLAATAVAAGLSPATAKASSIDAAVAGVAAAKDSLLSSYTALNELLWTILGHGEMWAKLNMVVKCRPRMKAGMWIRARLWNNPNAGVYQHLTAYCETVSHRMVRQTAGQWETSTTLNLTRGKFSTVANDFPWTVAAGRKSKVDLDLNPGAAAGAQLTTLPLVMSSLYGDAGNADAVPPKWRLNLEAVLADAQKVAAAHPQFALGVVPGGGFRTQKQNEEQGGAKNSAHLYGLAIDLRSTNGTDAATIEAAIRAMMKAGTIRPGYVSAYPLAPDGKGGFKNNFVHYDIRGQPVTAPSLPLPSAGD